MGQGRESGQRVARDLHCDGVHGARLRLLHHQVPAGRASLLRDRFVTVTVTVSISGDAGAEGAVVDGARAECRAGRCRRAVVPSQFRLRPP